MDNPARQLTPHPAPPPEPAPSAGALSEDKRMIELLAAFSRAQGNSFRRGRIGLDGNPWLPSGPLVLGGEVRVILLALLED